MTDPKDDRREALEAKLEAYFNSDAPGVSYSLKDAPFKWVNDEPCKYVCYGDRIIRTDMELDSAMRSEGLHDLIANAESEGYVVLKTKNPNPLQPFEGYFALVLIDDARGSTCAVKTKEMFDELMQTNPELAYNVAQAEKKGYTLGTFYGKPGDNQFIRFSDGKIIDID